MPGRPASPATLQEPATGPAGTLGPTADGWEPRSRQLRLSPEGWVSAAREQGALCGPGTPLPPGSSSGPGRGEKACGLPGRGATGYQVRAAGRAGRGGSAWARQGGDVLHQRGVCPERPRRQPKGTQRSEEMAGLDLSTPPLSGLESSGLFFGGVGEAQRGCSHALGHTVAGVSPEPPSSALRGIGPPAPSSRRKPPLPFLRKAPLLFPPPAPRGPDKEGSSQPPCLQR